MEAEATRQVEMKDKTNPLFGELEQMDPEVIKQMEIEKEASHPSFGELELLLSNYATSKNPWQKGEIFTRYKYIISALNAEGSKYADSYLKYM